jgi:phosphoglycerate dehydrogenase-like enzyme
MTPDTRHLVSAQRLASMKDGAILINTARGGLVDEQAMINELDSGRLYAGLDVFEEEPLPKESPLMGLDNVVLAPHLGSATAATRQAMMERALANVVAGFSGEPIPFCVNPVVYKKR